MVVKSRLLPWCWLLWFCGSVVVLFWVFFCCLFSSILSEMEIQSCPSTCDSESAFLTVGNMPGKTPKPNFLSREASCVLSLLEYIQVQKRWEWRNTCSSPKSDFILYTTVLIMVSEKEGFVQIFEFTLCKNEN